ncbi:MAG: glycosyltransferase family 4 protein [Halioglobus sp.]
MSDAGSMRIAIVHEWIVNYSGSERVLEQMLQCFPQADLYSLVDFIDDEDRGFILGKKAQTSFIQKMPFAKKKYRGYLPLMPFAIEQFDLAEYDLVISSSHAVAKAVITGPGQLHLCMCYSPMRYAWDLQHQYLRESGLSSGLKGWFAKWFLHRIRIWDVRTSNGVDKFIAISNFVARRIRKVYRRESDIIYPPVDIERFPLCEDKQDYFVTASRMVPYKRIDLIVSAFSSMPDKKLVVIGDGPDFEKIKALAGDNVELLGFQSNEVLRDKVKHASAFIFAAEEDFGIVPLEAQSCGTPVIAYGRGGALETVVSVNDNGVEPTGVFFYQQNAESICEAVRTFQSGEVSYSPQACRANAELFSNTSFRKTFTDYVDSSWAEFVEERNRNDFVVEGR